MVEFIKSEAGVHGRMETERIFCVLDAWICQRLLTESVCLGKTREGNGGACKTTGLVLRECEGHEKHHNSGIK